MTYPSGPSGSPGYPSAQQPPTNPFAAQTQQFGKVGADPAPAEGQNRLPLYLAAVVAALGVAVYLSSFFPLFTLEASDFAGLGTISGSSFGLVLAVGTALLSGLLAGASLLPRQTVSTAVYSVLAVGAFLFVIAEVINKPTGAAIDVGLYLIIAFSLFQAICAVAALLFEAGVITPPAPRPRYDQPYGQQYGAPGPYYGQPGQHQVPGPQQRPGYPGSYGGYPGGPSTGGYPAQQPPQQQGAQPGQQGQSGQQSQHGQQSGPPTPPTGFPAYGQPPSSSAPTTQVPAQGSPSSQSGQSSS